MVTFNSQNRENIINTCDQRIQSTDESMIVDKGQTSEATIDEKDKSNNKDEK